MSEDQNTSPYGSEQSGQGAAQGQGDPGGDSGWQEVGRQFQELGDSLAKAVRAAWEREDTQRSVHEMQEGLESMVSKVNQAINESANSPKGRQVKEELNRAANNLRIAGEQTVQETRPHLVSALKQLNIELQKFIDQVESASPKPADEKGNEENIGPDVSI
jgi:hypothetical protein